MTTESPYPDGTPEFIIKSVEDSVFAAEQRMADPTVDSNFARGYWMAVVEFRNGLMASKSEEDFRREQRRLEAVAALQKGSSGQPS